MTDLKLKELILNHIEYSKILKEQCNKNNIEFYDTSFNRDDILKKSYGIFNELKTI